MSAELEAPASETMMMWQYRKLMGQLMLAQEHAIDRSCPCELASEYEYCLPKHLILIQSYAEETMPMTDDQEAKELLQSIAGGANDLRRAYEEAEEEGRPYDDIADFARDRRKALEPYLFSYKEPASAESPLLLYLEERMGMPAPFGWVGGKHQLSKSIVDMIPPHRVYVEPFCGSAAVFWRHPRSEVEVLNDKDADLMRFYREIGGIDHCDIKSLSARFDEMKARQGRLEPCEFLSVLKCSFGDKRESKAMPSDCASNAMMFHKRLPLYQERIRGVKLMCGDWEKAVRQYDSPETFFYLDPPYHGTSRGYQHDEDQLARLAEVLPTLKGKWLLSYDDDAEVREAFRSNSILAVASRYTIQSGPKATIGKQLLIANYPLDGAKMGEEWEVCKVLEICHNVAASSKKEAEAIARDKGEQDTNTRELHDWKAKRRQLHEGQDACQEARTGLMKYLEDLKAGHKEGAQYWKGYSDAYSSVCIGEVSAEMGKRIRYNRGDLDSAIAAAKRLKADHPLYIFATAYGYTIEHRPPVGSQQYIVVAPDGKVDYVGPRIPEEVGEMHQDDFKEVGPYLVHRYEVLGSGVMVYDVYELDEGNHSTIMSIKGRWYGTVSSRILPEELAKLPAGDERVNKVMMWQEGNYRESYGTILEAYPELKDRDVRWSHGEAVTLKEGALSERVCAFDEATFEAQYGLVETWLLELKYAHKDHNAKRFVNLINNLCQVKYVGEASLGQGGIVSAIGTGLGFAAGFTLFDWLRGKIKKEEGEMGDDISGKEYAFYQRKIKELRSKIFDQNMTELPTKLRDLWAFWGLPVGSITPEYYVYSVHWQVAPERLTAQRLKEALEEDLGVNEVPMETAQNMLARFTPNQSELSEVAMGEKPKIDRPRTEGKAGFAHIIKKEEGEMGSSIKYYVIGSSKTKAEDVLLLVRTLPANLDALEAEFPNYERFWAIRGMRVEIDGAEAKETTSEHREDAHPYAIEVEGSAKSIIERVASSDARAEFKDKESGAYIRLDPDNLNQIHIEYNDQIAESETDKEAVEILEYLRKHKKFPYSAYVFEEAPYHKDIPSDLIYYSTTIEKHYHPSSACHKGSVRVLKPTPQTLVYIGCLKKDKWDEPSSTCSPNPTVLMTIVLNNKKNREEAQHLKLVHPEIKEHHDESTRGIEPRMGEGGDDRVDPALDQAMKDAEEV
jgi:DNA adenine methylase